MTDVGMWLTVLGCSGSTSGVGEPASAYLVETAGARLVLDLGPGAFGALWARVDPRRVDAYLVSHLHPDHCLDLCAVQVAARHSPTAPWPTVPLYGPAHARERLSRAYDSDPVGPRAEASGPDWVFDFRTWTGGPVELADCTIRTAPAAHPTEAYAIRVDHAAGSLTYTGDTGWSDAVVDLARGSDLLLAEATFVDGPDLPPGIHLSGRLAGRMAAEAGVRALMITHVPPWHVAGLAVAEACAEFDGGVLAAVGQRQVAVGR